MGHSIDEVWQVLIEVKDKVVENSVSLSNHLSEHKKRDNRQFQIVMSLIGLLGVAVIAYFIK